MRVYKIAASAKAVARHFKEGDTFRLSHVRKGDLLYHTTIFDPCYHKDPQDVTEWLKELQTGDTLVISIVHMSEEEYEALPEWHGP